MEGSKPAGSKEADHRRDGRHAASEGVALRPALQNDDGFFQRAGDQIRLVSVIVG
jgi:hypothetical protein